MIGRWRFEKGSGERNAHLRVLANTLGVGHAIDSRARPALRNPPSSVSAIAGYLHPATPHASTTEIKWRSQHGREVPAKEAIAKVVGFETAAAERIVEERIFLERSVKVSKYRVKQDEWVREAPWARM